MRHCLFFALLALCAAVAHAQSCTSATPPPASYVVVRGGVAHCGAITRTDAFFGSSRILVGDTLRLRLEEVIELSLAGRYYRRTADGRYMAERISAGRLDLYRRVHTSSTMVPSEDATHLPLPASSRIDYVARSGEAPEAATYSVVLALVKDDPESMRALDAYHTRSRIGFGLSMSGVALMGIGAATTDWKSDSPQLSSFLFAGAIMMAASPFLFSGRSGDIRRAIEAYNR